MLIALVVLILYIFVHLLTKELVFSGTLSKAEAIIDNATYLKYLATCAQTITLNRLQTLEWTKSLLDHNRFDVF